MTGIIGAMDDEVKLLREAMENTKTESAGVARISGGGASATAPGGGAVFEFITGSLDGKDAVLLRCGIGKVNAAVGCALMIERYRPSLVINTGSAGGIDPALTVGDAVISTGLIQHDVDLTGFGYPPGKIPGMPEIFPVDATLVGLAGSAIDALKAEKTLPENFRHLRGTVVSGDIFMHEAEKIAALKKTFPEALAVEMEGAAIAQCCWLFGVPCLIVRAISDVAGKDSPLSFDEFLPVAAKHSGDIVRRVLKLRL